MGIEDVAGKVKKSDRTSVQFLRYLVVGGIATAADVGVVALCAYLFKTGELAANVVGFTIGLTVNYILSILWVFEKSKVTGRLGEFITFAAIGLVGLGLRAGIIWGLQLLMAGAFFSEWFLSGLNEMIRTGIAIVIVTVYNFAARKMILYRETGKAE